MNIADDLQKLANPKKAEIFQRFFKTGKGEYGEGDKFIGLTVPQQRIIAKKYRDLPLTDIEKLLHNTIHEYRLTALLILVDQYKKSDEEKHQKIYLFYLANTKYINNWDLVDLSAPTIVGGWLINKPNERKILYTLVKSKNLWERRITVLATFAFIKKKEFGDIFAIAQLLLADKHDLIHKAVGWMLREAGKMNETALTAFLKIHYKTMPRTMLRYAIEKFSNTRRRQYLLSAI